MELDDVMLGLQFAQAAEASEWHRLVSQDEPRDAIAGSGVYDVAPARPSATSLSRSSTPELPVHGGQPQQHVASTRPPVVSAAQARRAAPAPPPAPAPEPPALRGAAASSVGGGGPVIARASVRTHAPAPPQPATFGSHAGVAAVVYDIRGGGSGGGGSGGGGSADDATAAGGAARQTVGSKKASFFGRSSGKGSAVDAPPAAREVVISGVLPGTFRHEGHVGLGDDGGFDVQNIPKVRGGGLRATRLRS